MRTKSDISTLYYYLYILYSKQEHAYRTVTVSGRYEHAFKNMHVHTKLNNKIFGVFPNIINLHHYIKKLDKIAKIKYVIR